MQIFPVIDRQSDYCLIDLEDEEELDRQRFRGLGYGVRSVKDPLNEVLIESRADKPAHWILNVLLEMEGRGGVFPKPSGASTVNVWAGNHTFAWDSAFRKAVASRFEEIDDLLFEDLCSLCTVEGGKSKAGVHSLDDGFCRDVTGEGFATKVHFQNQHGVIHIAREPCSLEARVW